MVPCATTVPAIEYVAPAPVIENVETAQVIEYIAPGPPVPNSLPSQSLPPAYTVDITGVASPRCCTAEPQIGDFGFDMFGKSFEVIRLGTEPRFSGQIRVLYFWEKRGRALGCDAATQRLHCKRARLLSRQTVTGPALQADGYATVIESICSTERVRFAEGYSCKKDTRRRQLQEFVRLCRAAWWQGQVPRVFFFERSTKEMTASASYLCYEDPGGCSTGRSFFMASMLPLCGNVVSAKFSACGVHGMCFLSYDTRR